jgi:hypothetical protein
MKYEVTKVSKRETKISGALKWENQKKSTN